MTYDCHDYLRMVSCPFIVIFFTCLNDAYLLLLTMDGQHINLNTVLKKTALSCLLCGFHIKHIDMAAECLLNYLRHQVNIAAVEHFSFHHIIF